MDSEESLIIGAVGVLVESLHNFDEIGGKDPLTAVNLPSPPVHRLFSIYHRRRISCLTSRRYFRSSS